MNMISHWPVHLRTVVLLAALTLASATAFAKSRTHVVNIGDSTIVVKITEDFDNVSKVRAECVIPRPQKTVWRVLTDYDNLEDIIPIVSASYVLGKEDGTTILRQEGRAGLWFLKRDFTVTLRVREVRMAYVGFESFEGDFRHFNGTWQIEQRQEGTWVAHTVEIQPDFFAPTWAIRRVAQSIMTETIEGVIRRCLTDDSLTTRKGEDHVKSNDDNGYIQAISVHRYQLQIGGVGKRSAGAGRLLGQLVWNVSCVSTDD